VHRAHALEVLEQPIVLDFPATIPSPIEPPAGLADALGLHPDAVLRSRFDVMVVTEDPDAVRGLAPDLGRLVTVDARGVIVTAPGDVPGVDFVSRFFAPRSGVPEDPVTGSAHCALGPYWAGRLGRTRLVGYQASARGGTVRVEVRGDRVRLAGQAVTVVKGALRT
jgi:PhzF family phenazine biosynthesis protein